MQAQRAPLSDGRWHFQHGPIDIVIGADGAARAVSDAHEAAWQRFRTLLDELVAELPLLRKPIPAVSAIPPTSDVSAQPGSTQAHFRGPVAQRMWAACVPYRADYITPMAAVAGAVAQELIARYDRPGVNRAWVNNGGDIALHLTPGHSVRAGLFKDLSGWRSALCQGGVETDAQWELSAEQPARGIATSGWRGRSFSLGIADSVTVLAATAAQADAAATVIANAVNVSDPAIVRQPACDVADDTDLGTLAVTVDVPVLSGAAVQAALQAGLNKAQALQHAGLIGFAALFCQGQWCSTAAPSAGRWQPLGSSNRSPLPSLSSSC